MITYLVLVIPPQQRGVSLARSAHTCRRTVTCSNAFGHARRRRSRRVTPAASSAAASSAAASSAAASPSVSA